MTAQESRNRRATLTLTESEDRDIDLVAAARGVQRSTLLRDATIAEIVAEAAWLRDELRRLHGQYPGQGLALAS